MASSSVLLQPRGPSCENESERLLLSCDQVDQLNRFRRNVRQCETDAEKFQLCAQVRGQLLDQHTQLELVIAFFEQVMLDECLQYGNYKKRERRKKQDARQTQADENDWDHFINVAANGSSAIKQLLPSAKAIIACWGQDKFEHYDWPARGPKFLRLLGALPRKMVWPELVTKANQLLLRKHQMPRKYRRRPIRDAPDSLDQVELDNLSKWLGQGPFVKDKDPEKIHLPCQKLTVEELPSGLGFDKYGLLVLAKYAIHIGNMDQVGSEKVLDEVLANAEKEAFTDAPRPSAAEEGYVQTASSPSTPSAKSSSTSRSASCSPISTASSTSSTDITPTVPDSCQGSTLLKPTGAVTEDPVPIGSTTLGLQHSRDLRPRASRLSYHETPATKRSKSAYGQARPLSIAVPIHQECCPTGIPRKLLSILDEHTSWYLLPAFMRLQPNTSYRDMCSAHLQAFAEAVTKTQPLVTSKSSENMETFASQGRRRRASLTENVSAQGRVKRPRTEEPISLQHIRTDIDEARDEEYRQNWLREHESVRSMRGSHGARTSKITREILLKSKPPTMEEANFCTGQEAAALAELGSNDIPIFTKGQQRSHWDSTSRPITQFFDYMEELGLKRTVSVQIPSRSCQTQSFVKKELWEVRDRFLSQQPPACASQDPWNLLDLQNPLPSILPAFLEGKNYQLLQLIRNAALTGITAERQAATTAAWNTWQNVTNWALLSEGGHNTPPHMDSHGYSTWITVQEGFAGFGWMSRPTPDEQDAWISDPHGYTGGEWRYVVLRPGDTVFFTSGTIHHVFRVTGGPQTLSLGGHILQWSGIVKWIEVIMAQLQHPDITNEDLNKATKYVQIVKNFVNIRIEKDRLGNIGNLAEAEKFIELAEALQAKSQA
ncbi:hypothetical protein QBC44DRAFT_299108 [Cladorrhinum sp. PSN332]|nr:hypothetical protein QBC44DRAFT_299108 [Cladorrhinum sp. PSN332]